MNASGLANVLRFQQVLPAGKVETPEQADFGLCPLLSHQWPLRRLLSLIYHCLCSLTSLLRSTYSVTQNVTRRRWPRVTRREVQLPRRSFRPSFALAVQSILAVSQASWAPRAPLVFSSHLKTRLAHREFGLK